MKSEAKTSAADYHLNTHSSNKTHIQLIKTRLCAPPPPSRIVHRPRLVTRLNEGLQHKLPLLSAPAGFGKTVLLSEWIADITPGVPYFQKILQKGTTFNDISASIKREILLTKMDNVFAIKKIISFEIKNSEIEQRKIIITFC